MSWWDLGVNNVVSCLVSWSSPSQVLPLRLAESWSSFILPLESFFAIFVSCSMQTVKQKCWLLKIFFFSCFPAEIISSQKPSPSAVLKLLFSSTYLFTWIHSYDSTWEISSAILAWLWSAILAAGLERGKYGWRRAGVVGGRIPHLSLQLFSRRDRIAW